MTQEEGETVQEADGTRGGSPSFDQSRQERRCLKRKLLRRMGKGKKA
jgi:hypothetical protein